MFAESGVTVDTRFGMLLCRKNLDYICAQELFFCLPELRCFIVTSQSEHFLPTQTPPRKILPMSTPIQQHLQSANAEYAQKFSSGHLPLPPAKSYVVVTCMDARIDPSSAFGISLGDAHVIRNAGGSARDALRSIVISQQLLGTAEILVIKHTGCGMLTFKNADGLGVVEKNLGVEARQEAENEIGNFLTFGELEEGVKDDIRFLKGETKLVDGEKTKVSGWVYEVETGKVRKVV